MGSDHIVFQSISKQEEIELLVKADEDQRRVEVKKLEIKEIEVKEKREHFWIYLIWSVGIVIIIAILILTGQIRWLRG